MSHSGRVLPRGCRDRPSPNRGEASRWKRSKPRSGILRWIPGRLSLQRPTFVAVVSVFVPLRDARRGVVLRSTVAGRGGIHTGAAAALISASADRGTRVVLRFAELSQPESSLRVARMKYRVAVPRGSQATTSTSAPSISLPRTAPLSSRRAVRSSRPPGQLTNNCRPTPKIGPAFPDIVDLRGLLAGNCISEPSNSDSGGDHDHFRRGRCYAR
jgi:hypothetical protein